MTLTPFKFESTCKSSREARRGARSLHSLTWIHMCPTPAGGHHDIQASGRIHAANRVRQGAKTPQEIVRRCQLTGLTATWAPHIPPREFSHQAHIQNTQERCHLKSALQQSKLTTRTGPPSVPRRPPRRPRRLRIRRSDAARCRKQVKDSDRVRSSSGVYATNVGTCRQISFIRSSAILRPQASCPRVESLSATSSGYLDANGKNPAHRVQH
ncbi:hypothetical protein OH76DRAFT_827074 [Lentinus brumalis]|uniref:Uncharacterized protein n=1 Tax=Lentinus brumalis TaxID=2498619 RepID=A0A371D2D7_9APHY|nr:hypothetical protein OH76DRAFT_827074 [Polyporus brumalis]